MVGKYTPWNNSYYIIKSNISMNWWKYINANPVLEKEWQSAEGKIKRKIPTGKGKRLIVGHSSSSEKGLIKDGEFIFKQNRMMSMRITIKT